jgi:PAS domain S-box-containing protein
MWLGLAFGALVANIALSIVTSVQTAGGVGPVVALELGITGVLTVSVIGLNRRLIESQHEKFHCDQVLAAAAATTRDWLWETDAEHRITYSSQGIQHLLGYRPEDVIGVLTIDLVAPDEHPDRLARRLGHVVSAQSSWENVEVAWRHRDGHPVALRGSALPMIDEAGRVTGYRGTRRFVSDEINSRDVANTMRRRVSEAVLTEAVDIALQPIVNLTDGRLVGVEALARFRDGRGPDAWFKDARETQQTLQLDRLTFFAALALVDELPAHICFCINASPELILDATFRRDLLREAGRRISRLVIEVTEHDRVHDYVALNEALSLLREHGVRFAVDDAGAGYASLTHIVKIRPDIIKLDRELLTDLSGDRARRSVITALVLLALDLGASVTGEGVETRDQLETLDTLAVDHGQGYLFAQPSVDPREWQRWTRDVWPHPSPATPRAVHPPSSPGSY